MSYETKAKFLIKVLHILKGQVSQLFFLSSLKLFLWVIGLSDSQE